MSKMPRRPWWQSIGFGKPPLLPHDDFADMGTAFGLDASLGKSDQPTPATKTPAPVPVRRRSPPRSGG